MIKISVNIIFLLKNPYILKFIIKIQVIDEFLV